MSTTTDIRTWTIQPKFLSRRRIVKKQVIEADNYELATKILKAPVSFTHYFETPQYTIERRMSKEREFKERKARLSQANQELVKKFLVNKWPYKSSHKAEPKVKTQYEISLEEQRKAWLEQIAAKNLDIMQTIVLSKSSKPFFLRRSSGTHKSFCMIPYDHSKKKRRFPFKIRGAPSQSSSKSLNQQSTSVSSKQNSYLHPQQRGRSKSQLQGGGQQKKWYEQ